MRSFYNHDADLELGEEDEDEETLQLKLAAIEAKLKLKKLQQNKTQSQRTDVDAENDNENRPLSSVRRPMISRSSSRADSHSSFQSRIEVPLSPTKRTATVEPRSPSRVLLGIDKGWKGSDVSLGRSSSVRNGNSRPTSRNLQRGTNVGPEPSPVRGPGLTRSKTFSERMAENRSEEVAREAQKEELIRKRSSAFKLDPAEMEAFRLAAEEANNHERPKSPRRNLDIVDYGREAVLAAYHENKSSGLRRSNTTPNLASAQRNANRVKTTTAEDSVSKNGGDSSLYDPFSHLHLSHRILPHSFLQRTFESAEPVRIPWLLRNVTTPHFELPSTIQSDIVVFGIVASKSAPKNHRVNTADNQVRSSNDWEKKWDDGSQNDRKFMVIKLTDLVWTIDLYLFSTALPRYHRLNPGTVVAILNPGIMPPKHGKEDTGQFSLTLNSDADQVIEIGTSRDLGFCKTVKKDGEQCGEWVDSRKSEFCDWHLDAQVRKTQAGRMGLNSSESSILSRDRFGSGGNFGSGKSQFKTKAKKGADNDGDDWMFRHRDTHNFSEGSSYNIFTGKYYCVSSGAPAANATNKKKMEGGFVSECMLEPDAVSKPERLRKRLATEAREREIAKKLGRQDMGRARSSAGGEYLRKGAETAVATERQQRIASGASSSSLSQQILSSSTQSSTSAAAATPTSSVSSSSILNPNGKRSADSVRLSPVKKRLPSAMTPHKNKDGNKDAPSSTMGTRKITRFITEKGIREAGRESLGAPPRGNDNDNNEEEDDDLDIV